MFVTKFYEYGNLQEFLTKTMGCLCWRDIIDMLWGMVSGGLERIHDSGFYHGNLHCGNLLIDELPESIHLKISDVGLHGPADGPGSGVYGVLPYVAPEVLRESTPISEQFDIAEEKRFLDLINKTFTQPAIHKEAVYVSRLLDFQSLHENSQ
ncbi:kinase-like protein [Gigaspora margarita]|uniref:Kinase-like protein n=1 Tax=Gigaspora margarita TaxID=4874 RepID=A0A8H4EJ05_GIGMA|nr:kinase-like protein [Gigaspora margarita]